MMNENLTAAREMKESDDKEWQANRTKKQKEKLQGVIKDDILKVEPSEFIDTLTTIVSSTQRLRNIFLLVIAQAEMQGDEKKKELYQTQFNVCKVILNCVGDVLERLEE